MTHIFDRLIEGIKFMIIKIPKLFRSNDPKLDPKFNRLRASKVEKSYLISSVFKSVVVIITVSIIIFLLIFVFGEVWPLGDYMNNIFCNTIALVFVVTFLDTIVSSNKEGRRKREESRAILRHDRIIQPDLNMYLARKNMVITPNGNSMHKFQINSDFTIGDMKDMYGPSELVADVGISKIKSYAYYQKQLKTDFEKLVEGVDFTYYPEVAEAAMKFINSTSYGEAALDAVVGYEDSKVGNRSMKTAVVSMIKEEPKNGRFMDANPTMKNVYLLHQMIIDQEEALHDYVSLVKALEKINPDEMHISINYK